MAKVNTAIISILVLALLPSCALPPDTSEAAPSVHRAKHDPASQSPGPLHGRDGSEGTSPDEAAARIARTRDRRVRAERRIAEYERYQVRAEGQERSFGELIEKIKAHPSLGPHDRAQLKEIEIRSGTFPASEEYLASTKDPWPGTFAAAVDYARNTKERWTRVLDRWVVSQEDNDGLLKVEDAFNNLDEWYDENVITLSRARSLLFNLDSR